jgi:hypothetical protein
MGVSKNRVAFDDERSDAFIHLVLAPSAVAWFDEKAGF